MNDWTDYAWVQLKQSFPAYCMHIELGNEPIQDWFDFFLDAETETIVNQ